MDEGKVEGGRVEKDRRERGGDGRKEGRRKRNIQNIWESAPPPPALDLTDTCQIPLVESCAERRDVDTRFYLASKCGSAITETGNFIRLHDASSHCTLSTRSWKPAPRLLHRGPSS